MNATTGQIVKRNDNGRRVRIVDVRPVGQFVFYVTEDCQDGHTTIVSARDVRPIESEGTRDTRK